MLTFQEYLKLQEQNHLDEGFFDSLRKSFTSSYQKASTPKTNQQNVEQYASLAMPALIKAQKHARTYAEKLGISIPLATSIIAAGVIGGPSVIPFAALMYFVRKPINAVAGAAFDKGAQKLGFAPQTQAPQTQAPQTQAPQTQAPQTQAPQTQLSWNYHQGFQTYLEMRELEEGWLTDRIGGAIGSVAGFFGGKAVKYSRKIGQLLRNSYNALAKFATENKLAIAKTAFLFAIGVAIGSGVAHGVNALAGQDELASQALQGVKQSGVVPDKEIQTIQQTVTTDITPDADEPDYRNFTKEPIDQMDPKTGKGWKGEIGNFTTTRAEDSSILFHSEDGNTYKIIKNNLTGNDLYSKLDPNTGQFGRASQITDYMRQGRGGWKVK